MQIDIFSDPICPWCFIGKRRLERFFERHPLPDLNIRWRVFQLNPGMPAEGMDRREYMAQKFGDEDGSRRMTMSVVEAGLGEGIAFAFDRIEKTPSTVDAHRLINMATGQEQQTALVERLFRAYFIEGLDIGNRETLIGLAAECGLDPDEVRARYDAGDGLDIVENESALAASVGIQGVPCFIVDGRYAVMGAQDPEHFGEVFERIAEMEAAREADEPEPI